MTWWGAWRAPWVIVLVACCGCQTAKPAAKHARPRGSLGTAPATESSPATATIIVRPHESIAVDELLARGEKSLAQERYAEAATDFRLVVENTVQAELRLRALLGWATALDLSGDPQGALRTYSRYVSEAAVGAERDAVRVRVVRLLVHFERYQEARELATHIDISGRTSLQRVALWAAQALGALQLDQNEEARATIENARSLIESEGFDRVTVPPLDVAALQYALGELRRAEAEKLTFDPLPADFLNTLEARCQWILDAQSAYSEAMRSQDAHWSAMSGVRVGQLYQNLHRDLMQLPLPAEADSSGKRQLVEGALRLRYAILLRKSLSMMRATVELLQRTKTEGSWKRRAEQALREIQTEYDKEQAAIDALPYTRDQLQQGLDHLANKARERSAGS